MLQVADIMKLNLSMGIDCELYFLKIGHDFINVYLCTFLEFEMSIIKN
jgi:hypothetical protein